jgi:hypothetical protein
MGEIILNVPKNEKYLDRSLVRSPIVEIAHLIARKLVRTLGDPQNAIRDGNW